MKKILFISSILFVLIFPLNLYSYEWEPLGKMNMSGMDVTIYVEKSSMGVDDKNTEFKKLWVKFDLPKNVKSNYSDELYRSRQELYYFHCGQGLYTVAQVKLLDSKDNMIYDSGEFDPYSEDFDSSWKLITPISGPDLVNTYVCKLDNDNTRAVKKVPAWMQQKKTKPEAPSLSQNIESGKISLKKIRWAMRDDGSERLVFDIYNGENKISKPENYKVIDEAKDNKIDIFFKSYENVGTSLPDLGQSKIISEIIISNNEEKQGVNIKLMLKNSSAYKVFEVENPGRLVVDFEPTGEAS